MGDGDYLVAGTPDDGLVTVDAATAAELSRTTLVGRAEVVDAGRVAALVATPAEIPDPAAAAAEVARLAGGDEAAYRDLLARDAPRVVVTADLEADREAIDAAIADGRLAGLRRRGGAAGRRRRRLRRHLPRAGLGAHDGDGAPRGRRDAASPP